MLNLIRTTSMLTAAWLIVQAGWSHAEEWVLKAAAKGKPGLEYLAKNSSLMFRAHPLVGLLKGLYKGNVPALLLDLGLRLSLPLLGFAWGWLCYELMLLGARVLGLGQKKKPVAPAAPPPAEPAPA